MCSALNLGVSGSAGFTLRKNYVKFLLNYECKFEHGGMDPAPILAQLEAMSQKKDKRSNPSSGKSFEKQKINVLGVFEFISRTKPSKYQKHCVVKFGMV